MKHVFESATEYMQQELNDPLYRVVFNDATQKYEVERIRRIQGREFYAKQKEFTEWEPRRIADLFKHGHWRTNNMEKKDFDREIQLDEEKVEAESVNKTRECGREFGKDIHNMITNPKIYSIPGVKNTRLQG
jgi:hypothetical protein